MKSEQPKSDEESISVNQPGLLRFRWSLFLALGAMAAIPLDVLAVDLLNPDHERVALDAAAQWIALWSTRLELLFIFSGLLVTGLVAGLAAARPIFLIGTLGWFLNEAIVGTLKRVVGRPRPVHPEAALEFIRPLYEQPDLKSFPSGHAATAVFFAVFIALVCRSRAVRALAVGSALVIMADRLYLGAHYLSDVLFGAAVGWGSLVLTQRLVALYQVPIRAVPLPRRYVGPALLTWVVLASWLLQAPLELKDALTGVVVEAYRFPPMTLGAAILEPITGPALRLAAMPDLRSFAIWGGLWAALGGGLYLFLRRHRAWPLLAGGLTVMLLWTVLALAGLPGARRAPLPRDQALPLAIDLQSHIGDPVDGGMSLEDGLARFSRLGYGLVVPTWHNAWSQGHLIGAGADRSVDLWGCEWSAGEPWESPLHLLLFNRRPQPVDPAETLDWRELIRRVQAEGGVVLASHFWRGDADRMPSAKDLVAAGIDGFEVAGRSQELRGEALDRLEEIRSLCRQHRLVATASSDFHGKRSGNYCWNLVTAGEGSAEDRVWRALTDQRETMLPVVLESPLDRDLGPFLPPAVVWSYFRELTLRGRASWLVWAGMAALLLGWRARRRPRPA